MSREVEPVSRSFCRRRSGAFTEVARLLPSGRCRPARAHACGLRVYYAMLCYAMLCYAMLCHAMPCYTTSTRASRARPRVAGAAVPVRPRVEAIRHHWCFQFCLYGLFVFLFDVLSLNNQQYYCLVCFLCFKQIICSMFCVYVYYFNLLFVYRLMYFRLASLVLDIWEERFYTPPPPGNNF